MRHYLFSVIFEVHPRAEQWDTYLATAKMLRPELEKVDGFVENIRYRSLTRDGWILSLSSWRHENAVIRWRTQLRHHEAQERGRREIFLDYHLRVGQFTKEESAVSLIDAKRSPDWVKNTSAQDVAQWLGLPSK